MKMIIFGELLFKIIVFQMFWSKYFLHLSMTDRTFRQAEITKTVAQQELAKNLITSEEVNDGIIGQKI